MPAAGSLSIKRALKHLTYAGVGRASYLGSSLLPARQRQSDQPALRIVMYHKVNDRPGNTLSVSPELFRRQLELLAREWRVIRPDDLRSAITERKTLPERAVLLTFDDGYEDNKTCAYPHLKELGLEALLFVCSRRVGTPGPLDHDIGVRAPNPLLDWQGLESVSDVFTIGSHAETHRLLGGLPHEEAVLEIVRSRREISEHMGSEPWAFSYPGGDWNDSLEDVVREAGYVCSFGTVPTAVRSESLAGARALPRYHAEPFDMGTFRLMMHGHCDLVRLKDTTPGKLAKHSFNRLMRTPG